MARTPPTRRLGRATTLSEPGPADIALDDGRTRAVWASQLSDCEGTAPERCALFAPEDSVFAEAIRAGALGIELVTAGAPAVREVNGDVADVTAGGPTAFIDLVASTSGATAFSGRAPTGTAGPRFLFCLVVKA